MDTMTFEEFDSKYDGAQVVDGFGVSIGTMYQSISCTGSTTDDYVWEVEIQDEYGDILETEVREVTKDGRAFLVEV